ncbi:MAG TPA: hypothetical protein VHJ20_24075 [Polyangia bacterium]|nr:hypothetical protein [Polyangia bacterium]
MSARAALVSIVLLAGCAAKPFVAARCQQDSQCGDGFACTGGACVARAAPPATWAVELSPRADSTAAFTELHDVSGAATTFDLRAGAKTTLSATLAADAAATPLMAAHFVLTVPSTIPGQPDLQFETDLPTVANTATPAFSLDVPKAIVGRTGTFEVLPLSPSDAHEAPVRASLPVAAQVELPRPSTRLTVRGRLLSAVGDPRAGFTARAFLGADLVSNVDVTTTDGVFTLVVPATALVTASTAAVTVDLEPATGSSDPRFGSTTFALPANVDLGDITMPAYGQPNAFQFAVHGDAADGPTVGGAIVRAWTLLADDPSGRTDFLRAAPTDGGGHATMSLLPGTTNALRDYDVAIVPPPESAYAVRCLSDFPLASGGTAQAPANVPPVILPRRAVLTGVVRGADGTLASGVMIVATRTAADASMTCGPNVGAQPATATTDDAGAFALTLDPGTYRIDYDPPSGAPFPRLTETGVVVAASASSPISHDVGLPAGALVEGTVVGPDGAALPLAGVRFFEAGCASVDACQVAPLLRAETRADATGHFRVVFAK